MVCFFLSMKNVSNIFNNICCFGNVLVILNNNTSHFVHRICKVNYFLFYNSHGVYLLFLLLIEGRFIVFFIFAKILKLLLQCDVCFVHLLSSRENLMVFPMLFQILTKFLQNYTFHTFKCFLSFQNSFIDYINNVFLLWRQALVWILPGFS